MSLFLLPLVLGSEFEVLTLYLVEFVIDAKALALLLFLVLLLLLCLFEALGECLSYLGDLFAINEQITALASHRNMSVRDVGTTVIGIDRSRRRAVGQELPDEPLGLAFEIALGNVGFRIG